MKFGKFLLGQQNEWTVSSPHHVNYKALKRIIAGLDLNNGLSPGLDNLAAVKTAFFFRLERELEKVNAFYLQKEAEFKVRLDALLDKRKRVQSRNRGRNPASEWESLREALVQFSVELDRLQKFVELNGMGFTKILKKFDKRSKSATKELYLSRQIEVQPCFNKEILIELSDSVATNLTEIEHFQLQESNRALEGRLSSSESPGEDMESMLITLLHRQDVSDISKFIFKNKSAALMLDPDVFTRVFFRASTDPAVSIEKLSYLLQSTHVDVSYADDINDRTAIHEIAITGRLDALRLCIGHGANLESTDIYGRKALHYVAISGRTDCATFLLSLGASSQGVDSEGYTPLLYGIIGGHTACVKIFLQHCASIEPSTPNSLVPLSLAAQHGHLDICTLLLDKGAKVIPNSDGLSALHLTCREGHDDITRLLIQHGADLNLRESFNGWTPLLYAASEGHYESLRLLMEAGASKYLVDDSKWTPQRWALYRGHIRLAQLLQVNELLDEPIATDSKELSEDLKPMAPSELLGVSPAQESMGSGGIQSEVLSVDSIPSLLLPPPIIPFRLYGHNYLDGKYYIEISFAHQSVSSSSPIKFFNSRATTSFRLVISSIPDSGIPYNIVLPLKDASEIYSYTISDPSKFTLQFDIYPAFGTKVVGRGVVLPSTLARAMSGGDGCIAIPLQDSYLKCVGEIKCQVAVVRPFIHSRLDVGGAIETYWKSTKTVSDSSGLHSFVTASSLAQEYLSISVQLTKDNIPVVYSPWLLPLFGDAELGLTTLTLTQARKLMARQNEGTVNPMYALNRINFSAAEGGGLEQLVKVLETSLLTLEEVLTNLPPSIGLNIELKYPTQNEQTMFSLTPINVNEYADNILQKVYDSAASRSIIFSSFNPDVCTTVNWKQPNYPIFFATHVGYLTNANDPRCTSIKEAIRFAKSSNLLGIICQCTPLIQAPKLIQTIIESGLLLATFGDGNLQPEAVAVQARFGVDAIVRNGVFKYLK